MSRITQSHFKKDTRRVLNESNQDWDRYKRAQLAKDLELSRAKKITHGEALIIFVVITSSIAAFAGILYGFGKLLEAMRG